MTGPITRVLVVSLLAGALTACAPATPSPTAAPPKPAATAAPAKPTEAAKPAPKPTEAPKPAAAPAKPTEAPAAKPSEKAPARALPPDYFAGKTITLVVPLSAGGPTDVFARQLQPFYEKHIPGKPTVVVENRTGAGGIVGMNYVYSAAKKDGTVIGIFSSPFAQQILESEGVKYDTAKFQWLGGVPESQVGFVEKSLGVKTPQELPSADGKIVVGGLGPSNAKDMAMRTFFNMLGLRYRYVTGFPGNADARAALLRGEINFFEESLTGYVTGIVPLVKDGTVFPIGQRGTMKGGKIVRDERVKDIPTYTEVAEQLKGTAIRQNVDYRALASVVKMGAMLRAIVYPAEIDAAIVEAMRKATDAVFADREFVAQVEKQLGFQLIYVPGAEAQAQAVEIVREAGADKEAVDHLKKLSKG